MEEGSDGDSMAGGEAAISGARRAPWASGTMAMVFGHGCSWSGDWRRDWWPKPAVAIAKMSVGWRPAISWKEEKNGAAWRGLWVAEQSRKANGGWWWWISAGGKGEAMNGWLGPTDSSIEAVAIRLVGLTSGRRAPAGDEVEGRRSTGVEWQLDLDEGKRETKNGGRRHFWWSPMVMVLAGVKGRWWWSGSGGLR